MAGSNRILEYIISAKDFASSVFDKVRNSVANGAKFIVTNFMNIKAIAETLAAGFQKAMSVMSEAMKFEAMEKKFAMLLHSAEDAKTLTKTLQELGETPPFSAEQFANAAQTLNAYNATALISKDMLIKLGNTAYGTGSSIESVADAFGRAYASIKDGVPLQRVLMMLQSTRAITPAVRQELQRMEASGASADAMWAKLSESLGRFDGAMDSAMETTQGVMGAVEGKWTSCLQEFGAAFLDLAKNEIKFVLDKLTELKNSGAITEWAEKAKAAIQPLVEAFLNLADAQSRQQSLKALGSFFSDVFGALGAILKAVFDYGADRLSISIKEAVNPFYEAKDIIADRENASAKRSATVDDALEKLRNAHKNLVDSISDAAEGRQKRAEEAASRATAATERQSAAEAELQNKADERLKTEMAAADAARQAAENTKAAISDIEEASGELGRFGASFNDIADKAEAKAAGLAEKWNFDIRDPAKDAAAWDPAKGAAGAEIRTERNTAGSAGNFDEWKSNRSAERAAETALSQFEGQGNLYRPSETPGQLSRYNGRQIIVDDMCGYNASTGVAEIYLFGAGAVAMNDVPERVLFEVARQAEYNRDAFFTRSAWIGHLRGVAWKGSPVKNTASNTELATAANWDRVYDKKDVRAVKLICKIA